MGTPDFAVPSLEKLHQSQHTIEAVVTVPDKPQGRGRQLRPSAVKTAALELGFKLLQPENLQAEEFIAELKTMDPDVIVVVAFQILPEAVFTIPKYGSFNLHASLLPKYRGAAPIHWVLLNGDTESGVTTFFLKSKVDTGNIIAQRKIPVLPTDNLHSLYNKLRILGADLVVETVDLIAGSGVQEIVQDNAVATPAPKVTSATQRLDFTETCQQCHNRVRAFAPKPGAFTFHNGSRLKILATEISRSEGQAGKVIAISASSFTIACGSGALLVKQVQAEGKKPMDVAAYLLGHPVRLGEYFG